MAERQMTHYVGDACPGAHLTSSKTFRAPAKRLPKPSRTSLARHLREEHSQIGHSTHAVIVMADLDTRSDGMVRLYDFHRELHDGEAHDA